MIDERRFQLTGRPLLSRFAGHNRELLLDDVELQAKLWPDARLLTVDQTSRVAVRDGGAALVFQRAADHADTPPPDAVLLDLSDGRACWAVRIERDTGAEDDGAARRAWQGAVAGRGVDWLDLRGAGGALPAGEAGLFATAVAVLNWHRYARFCARCGAPVRLVRAGWASRCTGCAHEEYPRTDPAVICLVHDDSGADGEHVLLARQPGWPARRYSVLAGFVEAGESLEECVVREIAEEVGVRVRDVRYLGNQSWPFPRSLMIGFAAVADRDAQLQLATGEIEAAQWFSRAEVCAALAAGGATKDFGLPGRASIAWRMIDAWAAH